MLSCGRFKRVRWRKFQIISYRNENKLMSFFLLKSESDPPTDSNSISISQLDINSNLNLKTKI